MSIRLYSYRNEVPAPRRDTRCARCRFPRCRQAVRAHPRRDISRRRLPGLQKRVYSLSPLPTDTRHCRNPLSLFGELHLCRRDTRRTSLRCRREQAVRDERDLRHTSPYTSDKQLLNCERQYRNTVLCTTPLRVLPEARSYWLSRCLCNPC